MTNSILLTDLVGDQTASLDVSVNGHNVDRQEFGQVRRGVVGWFFFHSFLSSNDTLLLLTIQPVRI
jgi:hypothetical protein